MIGNLLMSVIAIQAPPQNGSRQVKAAPKPIRFVFLLTVETSQHETEITDGFEALRLMPTDDVSHLVHSRALAPL
jgi:hypothetical protein